MLQRLVGKDWNSWCLWLRWGVLGTLPFRLFLAITSSCSRRDPHFMNIHAQRDYSCSNPGSEWDDKKPPEQPGKPSITWNKQIIRESQTCVCGKRKMKAKLEDTWRLASIKHDVEHHRERKSSGWDASWGHKERFVIPWPPQSTQKPTWLSWEARRASFL